jgi:thiamine-phosphate pyrophosphorylase
MRSWIWVSRAEGTGSVILEFDARYRPLVRVAAKLSRRAGQRNPTFAGRRLPGLWFVTDPARIPDPVTIAAALPRGSGVIYRAFGAADAETIGRELRRVTRKAEVLLLVGADAGLARTIEADGVHLPERLAHRAKRLRQARADWLITVAAHDRAALERARRFAAHAAVVSAVFPSRSPSAGGALGVIRFETLVRSAGLPVIALGGIGARTAVRLGGSACSGLAAVEAFASRPTIRA